MKFKLETIITIPDENILDIVNDNQEWENLEEFTSLEEVPIELILMCLDEIDYFQVELDDYLSIKDFDITVMQ